MRLLLIFFFFLNVFSFPASAQEYRTHKVEDGDTVYNLAKKYHTTEEAIYELNPGSKTSIQLGQVLVIPPEKIGAIDGKKPLRFENYVVKQKETVFGISQQNGIDISDLKKYNPYLYKEELGMGDTIQVPIYTKGKPKPINYNESIQNSTYGNLKHVVLPKETKYGIAKKYNMEVGRLKALNPGMGTIQPGQVLVVSKRNPEVEKETINKELFQYYVVKPYDKGSRETVYSLTQKFGISKDSLFALNPNLRKDGLEAGMKLKVPILAKNTSFSIGATKNVNLADHLSNFETKELVVMLPFKLETFETDSLAQNKSQLKDSRISRISLDFYTGILMALETAKEKGISVNLRVYDTQQSTIRVQEIIQNNDFDGVQAVIGPLLGSMIELTAQQLSNKNIPVFSPLTKMEMTAYDNLIQTRPTDDRMRNVMLAYMDSIHTDENIVLITDTKNSGIKTKILATFPGASVFVTTMSEKDDFLKKSEVANHLDKQKENWVILESDDILLLNIATAHLNLLRSEYTIRLFTTNRNEAFESDEISNNNLSNLNFTFPTFTKEPNEGESEKFIEKYTEAHGVKPGKYAVRGYDLTYDILLRMASSNDFYKSLRAPWTTEYVENKFHYEEKQSGGYLNNAVYILKYGEDLSLKPVGI